MEPLLVGILDGIEEGICVFSGVTGLVTYTNAAYRELSGVGAGPMHWASWLSSVHVEALSALERAVADGRRHTVVIARTTGDCSGQLLVRISPVTDGCSYMMTIKTVDAATPAASLPSQRYSACPPSGPMACTLPATAESLLRCSPQPMCIIELPDASSSPAVPAPNCAGSQPQGLDACPSGAVGAIGGCTRVAATGPQPHGMSRASSGASCLECGAGVFQWAAYALLPGDVEAGCGTATCCGASGGGFGGGSSRRSSSDHLAAPVAPCNLQAAAATRGSPCTAGAATGAGEVRSRPAAAAPVAGQGHDPDLQLGLGNVVYSNEAMLRLCGYSQESLRAGGLALLLRPPSGAVEGALDACGSGPVGYGSAGHSELQRLTGVMATGAPTSLELPCYHSSGQRLWCSLAVSAVDPAPPAGPVAEAASADGYGWRRHAGVGYSPRGEAAATGGCGDGAGMASRGGQPTPAGLGARMGCEGGGPCTASAVAKVGGQSNSSRSASSSCGHLPNSNNSSCDHLNNSGTCTNSSRNSNDERRTGAGEGAWGQGVASLVFHGDSGTGGDGAEGAEAGVGCSGGADGSKSASALPAGGTDALQRGCGVTSGPISPSCMHTAPQRGSITAESTRVCDAASVGGRTCGQISPLPSRRGPETGRILKAVDVQQQRHQAGGGGHQDRANKGEQQPQELEHQGQPALLSACQQPLPPHGQREAHNTLRAHALGDLAHCQSPRAPSPTSQQQQQQQQQGRQQQPASPGASTEGGQQQLQQREEYQGQTASLAPRRYFLIVFNDLTTAMQQQQQQQQDCQRPQQQQQQQQPVWQVRPAALQQPGLRNDATRPLAPQPTGSARHSNPSAPLLAGAPAVKAAGPLRTYPCLPAVGSMASLLAAAGGAVPGPTAAPVSEAPGAEGRLASALAAVAAAAAAGGGCGSGGGCAACQLHDFALDSLREGITLADASSPEFPIMYTNQAFLSMTGYTREEVLGRNCRFLQGPDTDPAAVQAVRDAIRLRQRLTVQLLNYTKAGQRFWNELRLAPVVSPATGQLVAYIGIQNDVTELVTRKQTEARLRDAKEAAESATEAKSQFLANMSHEIRTPLNGMIATAQLLLGSVLTPEQRELTETILESGSTLVGILGDILDFSKIDHGSLELQPRPMCLRQATEACIDLVAAEAAKKGLALAYLLDDEALARPLLGDPVRIRQVLANLLSNAVKFTDKGEVVVRVSVVERDPRQPHPQTQDSIAAATETAPAPPQRPPSPAIADGTAAVAAATTAAADGAFVHVTVTDTGIGIDEESARKLFQHFRQGSETMSRRYGGTGLGLAISKRLAQLMRGDIWVESRKGAGSTFHFTLGAAWASAGAGPWLCSPSRSAASTPSQSSGCTPRTSTDEGQTSGSGSTAAAAAAALSADVVDAISRCGSSLLYASSACGTPPASGGGGDASRLSNGSNTSGTSGSGRSGRELRTSPWQADGTARQDTAAAEACAPGEGGGDGSSSSGGLPHPGSSEPASISAHRSSCGGASSSGAGAGGTDASEERAVLTGRSVLVDVSHGATSTQVWNSCRQLGLYAVQANACALPLFAPAAALPPPSDAPPTPPPQSPTTFPTSPPAVAAADTASLEPTTAAATSTTAAPAASAPASLPQPPLPQQQQQPPFDILIVSVDRLVPALKAGWKGRPVVALGDRAQLPPALQPLVVALAVPVRHHRLATALVKATALLRWNGSSAPKLANTPIPNESIQTLKSWRLKRGHDWESVNRRTSLDNSALERAAMARGGGAAAGGPLGGGGGSALGRSGFGLERSPPRQQQAPIPENAELSNIPGDDAAGSSSLGQLPPRLMPERAAAAAATAVMFPPPLPPPPPSAGPTLAAGAAAATGAERPAAASTDAAGGGGLRSLERLRILIAEDNKVNQKVVLKVLQQILRGCQPPDVVENGLQVLQALQKKTYDLILMDIHMPEMDGLEASKRIQETYKPEDRPRIIALSADTVQTLHDRCREAGIEAFLVKPFRIEELARVMRTGTPRLNNKALEAETCASPLAV